MTKLWQTETAAVSPVQSYTVGDDYLLDTRLLPYDLKASAAHAALLAQMGVLTGDELTQLTAGLEEIAAAHAAGTFLISESDEDGHTAIENYLTQTLGEVGKKIHTGRSRNDQSLTMLRLYMLECLQQAVLPGVEKLVVAFDQQAKKYSSQVMPGYTHMQKAMPTTVGTWLSAYGDAFRDQLPLLKALGMLLDQNPLGSASGFGIGNFVADKSITTKALGFSRTQENPIYAGMTRGSFELILLHTMQPVMLFASRFAADMMLFTTSEFGFFSLPDAFTTGSSIMPQKRNYDVFEIMRARTRSYDGNCAQIAGIVASLPSGYNRDMQLTKKPLLEACDHVVATLGVLQQAVAALQVHSEQLHAAMTDDLYATEKVYHHVAAGMSFRDAYRLVKRDQKL